MSSSVISSVSETLKSEFEFEFSLDFQGQVEYIESENTDQFLEYELVLLYLVEKGIVPINERTEGFLRVQMGIVYLDYRTCTEVGEDWNEDIWEEYVSEHLVLNIVGE